MRCLLVGMDKLTLHLLALLCSTSRQDVWSSHIHMPGTLNLIGGLNQNLRLVSIDFMEDFIVLNIINFTDMSKERG